MKTTDLPALSKFVFCAILVIVQHQSANGLNWNNGGSGSKWQLNCDFSGHDIEKISSTGDKCGSLCIASINCTHFRHASDGFCYLKNAPPSILPTVTTDGACGFVPWKFEPGRDHWNVDTNGAKWLTFCDFVGHDIGQERSSADMCGDVCLKNPECSHFRHDGEFCHVKKAPLTTLRTAVNGGVCGYIPSRDFPSPDLPKNRCSNNKLQFIFIFMAATMSVMKTTDIPALSKFVFCAILVIMQHQFVNGQNWNDGARDVKWRMHCNFPGQEIERIEATGDRCGSLCIASRECTHFHHANDGYCHLKKAPLSTSPTLTTEGMCGFVPWKFEPGRDHWNVARSGVKWLNDCDFFGHDIGRERSSADMCGDVCLKNPECTHFRHVGEFCYVKKASLTTLRTAVNGGICGYISSRDFGSDKNQQVGQNWNDGARDVKWRMHCNFPGQEIERIEATGDRCGSLCIASRECTHFDHANDGYCHLKKAPLSTSPTLTTEGMCGYVPWKFEPGRDHWNVARSGVKWLNDCDFFGHDIGRERSSAELCGDVCLKNPECNHFRFSGDGFCYVKKAPLTTSRSATDGGVCGYIPSRDFGSGNNVQVNCPKVDGLNSNCRPNIHCSIWYDEMLKTPGTSCKLDNNAHGSCCPDPPKNRRTRDIFMQATSTPSDNQELVSKIKSQIESAFQSGRMKFQSMQDTEDRLVTNNIVVLAGSSSALNSLVFHTTPESQKINQGALIDVYTAEDIVNRFGVKPKDVDSVLNQFKGQCPPPPSCRHNKDSPYRTMDGSCNNIKRSTWGQSRTQFQRILFPVYSDGIRQIRRAKNGGVLPSPRLISSSVVRDASNQFHEINTNWVAQFGQFLDHDLTQTVESKMSELKSIECCLPNGQFIDKTLVHPECLPIEIPANDPFYSKFNRRCMSFVRSAPAHRSDCKLGHAEQMNDNTHFLDASPVYGSDDRKARDLRAPTNQGHLRVTHFWKIPTGHHQFDLLPADEEIDASCALSRAVSGIDPPNHVKCFDAGDPRSNVIPGLSITHTIFLRQHNKLVRELAAQNPHRDGEHLYQEARRIVIAQMQHITYNEFLPVVLGREKMREVGLFPLDTGFSTDYDPTVNPSIVNEFSASAFRFGHSIVQGLHHLVSHERRRTESILLRNHFFKSQTVYTPGNIDKYLIGLATQPHQKSDAIVTEELTNHLFEEEGKGYGLDLVSLNLQRGRDHGMPPYNDYRLLCGLSYANNFDDLLDHIPKEIVDKFKSLYTSVDDVDFFIGGLSERPASGSLVGPTFQCIIADQFLKLKKGDRFFYDLGGQSGSFTESQLQEIRKTSLARLICDNSDVKTTQPLLFKSKSPELNPIVNCDSDAIPRLDLSPWASRLPTDVWHIGEGGVKYHMGCDFPGHDVTRHDNVPNREQCGKLCVDESRCNAFTQNDQVGMCFLKNIPATLIGRTPVPNGICGFLPWKF